MVAQTRDKSMTCLTFTSTFLVICLKEKFHMLFKEETSQHKRLRFKSSHSYSLQVPFKFHKININLLGLVIQTLTRINIKTLALNLSLYLHYNTCPFVTIILQNMKTSLILIRTSTRTVGKRTKVHSILLLIRLSILLILICTYAEIY